MNRHIEILRNHASMFGYVSCARAVLSALIGPAYSKESFDRRFGTDTTALSLQDSQIPFESMSEAVEYEPANISTLHHIFRSVPFKQDDYHLIDIGCGKGRTLMVSSNYPFRAITGIELSPVTAEIAQRNIATYVRARHRWLRCPTIQVFCEDGSNFEVPEGNLFCVLYNPFFGQTFQRCIEHLHQAAIAKPEREIWLAYINPWHCEEWLLSTGYFQQVAKYRVIPRTWTWSLWRYLRRA